MSTLVGGRKESKEEEKSWIFVVVFTIYFVTMKNV